MFSLAPWNYRNLIKKNDFIDSIETYKFTTLSDKVLNEVLVKLNQKLVPKWANNSIIYSSSDGSGTSEYSHIAIYKAISEALERWAFYETIDKFPKSFSFEVDPSTNGMASYPGFTSTTARNNAILEATERWAVSEFWKGHLPIRRHDSNIKNLQHYEILTKLKNIHVSLLAFEVDGFHCYSFACETTLKESFSHAMIELSRNIRVLKKFKNTNKTFNELLDINDKRLVFFSEKNGYDLFLQRILSAPRNVNKMPELICDAEIRGEWTKYSRVWRYLYNNSFPQDEKDHTIFMF